MRIVANRQAVKAANIDDIIKRRDEYDAKIKELDEQEKEFDRNYRRAEQEATDSIEQNVSELIGPTSLNLRITADHRWTADDSNNWWIRINANEYPSKEMADKVSLRWSWDVYLDRDGNVKKDSSSWSGLQAITPEQMSDLEESVRVLKILNSANWHDVLTYPSPKFDDYYNTELLQQRRQLKNDRPDFETDIRVAELESLVGTNTAVKLTGDEYFKGEVYIIPTGFTDKFIRGYIFPEWYYSVRHMSADEIKNSVDERRTSKNKLAIRNGELVKIELA